VPPSSWPPMYHLEILLGVEEKSFKTSLARLGFSKGSNKGCRGAITKKPFRASLDNKGT